MLAHHDADLLWKLRDHFRGDKTYNQNQVREWLDHFRPRAIAIGQYDPDSGTYLPSYAQGDVQCFTFWPGKNSSLKNILSKANTDFAKNPDPKDPEVTSTFAGMIPAASQAFETGGENAPQGLQNQEDLFALLTPLRNLDLRS